MSLHPTLSGSNLIGTQQPNFLGSSNLHLDVLMGRDETIEPADVFLGELLLSPPPSITFQAHGLSGMETSNPLDIHKAFEKKYNP